MEVDAWSERWDDDEMDEKRYVQDAAKNADLVTRGPAERIIVYNMYVSSVNLTLV